MINRYDGRINSIKNAALASISRFEDSVFLLLSSLSPPVPTVRSQLTEIYNIKRSE
jgi:hypothetical protein